MSNKISHAAYANENFYAILYLCLCSSAKGTISYDVLRSIRALVVDATTHGISLITALNKLTSLDALPYPNINARL